MRNSIAGDVLFRHSYEVKNVLPGMLHEKKVAWKKDPVANSACRVEIMFAVVFLAINIEWTLLTYLGFIKIL